MLGTASGFCPLHAFEEVVKRPAVTTANKKQLSPNAVEQTFPHNPARLCDATAHTTDPSAHPEEPSPF